MVNVPATAAPADKKLRRETGAFSSGRLESKVKVTPSELYVSCRRVSARTVTNTLVGIVMDLPHAHAGYRECNKADDEKR